MAEGSRRAAALVQGVRARRRRRADHPREPRRSSRSLPRGAREIRRRSRTRALQHPPPSRAHRRAACRIRPASVRIGIIGAGVSGMTAAWLLQHDHHVTLIDEAPRLGGHVETIPIVASGDTVHAELGPRFFFDTAYPYFLALLRLLAVPIRWNDGRVSFTDVARAHTVVLPPRSLRQVASLLRSPRLVRHVLSLRRLIEEQPVVAARRDFSITFRRHLAEGGYPASFGPEFAYPFLAACWGAPLAELPDFPVYSLLKGMPPGKRPGFYEVQGGMSRYVRAFGDELTRVDIRLGAGVRRVERRDDFRVEDARGERHRFDRLIVATSARDAAELLRGVPTAA